jgi:hypothetical protein
LSSFRTVDPSQSFTYLSASAGCAMTKQGDGPTTRRRVYGYQQARAAGAPFRNEKTEYAINVERTLKRVESLTMNYNRFCARLDNPKETARRLAKKHWSADEIVDHLRMASEEAKREWWARL